MYKRSETRPIMVGNVQIGGNNEVIIQSMTNTKTHDVEASVKQILALEKAGVQVVRVACLTIEDANAIKSIKQQVNVPIVADIHFDYRIALAAIEAGVDKIRINPGNIGDDEKVFQVVQACKKRKIPIRIGVNAGSLEKHLLDEYGYPCAKAMVASAKYHVDLLEKMDFFDICLSLKASDLNLAIEAYQLAAKTFKYPLHLGITEAGTKFSGTIKSVAGLSILLYQEIGSTIRISLSTDPCEEIKVARELLKNFSLANNIPTLIACPTCGRLQYEMFDVVNEIEQFLESIEHNIHVAIMGCPVNGPGEAKQADIGVAGGNKQAILFKKGEIIKTVKQEDIVQELKLAINELVLEIEKKKKLK